MSHHAMMSLIRHSISTMVFVSALDCGGRAKGPDDGSSVDTATGTATATGERSDAGTGAAADAEAGASGDAGIDASDATAPALCESTFEDLGTAWVADAEVPVNHRPAAASCPSQRGAGPGSQPYPESALALDAGGCTSDSQCTAGVNGRCFPPQGVVGPGGCSYDECFADSDCGSKTPCLCRCSSTDNSANVCDYGGNCAIDTDCGPGGYCSPSWDNCSIAAPEIEVEDNYAAPYPYYCHTAVDTCINDADCPPVDSGIASAYCAYNTQEQHWACIEPICFPP